MNRAGILQSHFQKKKELDLKNFVKTLSNRDSSSNTLLFFFPQFFTHINQYLTIGIVPKPVTTTAPIIIVLTIFHQHIISSINQAFSYNENKSYI